MISEASVAPGAASDVAIATMRIYSEEGDELLAATVDPTVAARIAIVADDDHAHDGAPGHLGHLDPGGSLGPGRDVKTIVIPADRAVELDALSAHLVLVGLVEPLTAGTSLPIVLTFERAGIVEARLAVR